MRILSALVLGVLIASCTRLESEAATRMCVVDVQMPSDGDRQRVLTANRKSAIEFVRRGEMVITPLADERLLIATRDEQCTAFRNLSIEGEGFNFHERILTVEQANTAFLPHAPQRLSHAAMRQCVIRFSEHDEEQFARLGPALWFVGLRGVQIEAADGEIFIAADESCAFFHAMVAEAHEQDTGGSPRSLQECERASLAACGFPDEIFPD